MLFHIAAAIKGFVRAFRVDRGLEKLLRYVFVLCPPRHTHLCQQLEGVTVI